MNAVLSIHTLDRFVSLFLGACWIWLHNAILPGVSIQSHQEVHMQEDDERHGEGLYGKTVQQCNDDLVPENTHPKSVCDVIYARPSRVSRQSAHTSQDYRKQVGLRYNDLLIGMDHFLVCRCHEHDSTQSQ
jgi:hypothetical protein